MVTTHDFLNEPGVVSVVRRSDGKGTTAMKEKDPGGVRAALTASGFSLGDHETKGFGS